MSEYTPTTEEVRNRYLSEVFPEDEAEFDRWLMRVKAEAWDEGWDAGYQYGYLGPRYASDNPYCEETE